ncbi:hypothetical protein CPC16_010141 [Podila verticillata]|nr:hypothetical protein CPC16_010141 [Podila verticillata]
MAHYRQSDGQPFGGRAGGVHGDHGGGQGPNLISLDLNFDPPGLQSKKGPRHDNDHVQIKDTQIVPTQVELTCERPPFLPSNDVPGALHHLPPGWSRLLDTHFQDVIDHLRKGIVIFFEALCKTAPDKQDVLLSRKRLHQIVGQDVSVNAYGALSYLVPTSTASSEDQSASLLINHCRSKANQ